MFRTAFWHLPCKHNNDDHQEIVRKDMVIELNFTIQIEVFNAFKTIFDTVVVVGVASCTLICQTVQSPVAVGPPINH